MSESGDGRVVVSISALIAAMRGEGVADASIGRILAATLGIDEGAARALVEGPPVTDAADLHQQLSAAQERGDWAACVALIGRVVEEETDDRRRAQYFYTAAVIQRVELKDHEAALASLDQTLDCDPSVRRAFEVQCAILSHQQDWRRLERAHRKMIYRVRGDAAREFELLHALAEIYRDRLAHPSAATEALKMALNLRPGDEATLEALHALGA